MNGSPGRSPRGFTIIELLMVIAIIGLLAAIVLAAVGSARARGIDASIKSQLASARSQAELFYASNSGGYYNGVCAPGTVDGAKSINDMVLAAARTYGLASVNTTLTTAGGAGIATCHDAPAGWAAEVPLKQGGFFCVDSTEAAATSSISTLGANDITCGP